MGVLGLWQLLAPVGQPVTLESLENKIFAVDISIWLNQAVKGYRDSQGGSVANAHLLSLFSRLCKLLFYRIRPIIVFDGGFPELKKQTIINRQQRRAAIKQASRDAGLKVLTNYLASQQLGKVSDLPSTSGVSFKHKEKPRDEIYKLPPLPESTQSFLSESQESVEDFERKFTNFSKQDIKYLNQIDLDSEDFNNLPADVKQEILSTLKESRRHRTWEQFEELPKESNEFSKYQMQCLLKKRKLQGKLEEVQKDLRTINSKAYVSQYTNDHVIGETNKIMSDDTSYYVLLKKIANKTESGSDKSSDKKHGMSAMADSKNAFIRDIENIDCFGDESDEGLAQAIRNSLSDVKKEDSKSLSSDEKQCPLTVSEEVQKNPFKVSNRKEICFSSFSDEEYDVDSPPMPSAIDEQFVSKTDSSHKRDLFIDLDEQQTLSVKQLSPKLKNDDVIFIPSANSKSESKVEIISSEESNKKLSIEIVNANNQLSPKAEIDNHDDDIFRTSIHNENESDVEIVSLKKSDPELFPESVNTCDRKSEPFRISLKESDGNLSNEAVVVSSEDELIACDDEIISSSDNDESNTINSFENFVKEPIDKSKDSTIFESSNLQKEQTLDSPSLLQISNKKLQEENLELQRDLETAAAILESEQAKQDRQARTVQDHMVEECKELLQLFGIPYIVSPLEAEAQCAFYDKAELTHGTITDDSDVWLFGGKRVLKNFFSQQKFVESYKDKEVFTHFGLSRKKLINFALLTGSDYTVGIEGVGYVTAMEIISEFPGEGIDALKKFKSWWDDSYKHVRTPENKVRAKLRKLVLAHNFPEEKIFDAYLNPEVDSSTEKFSWGRPDLAALRDYTRERFGWNQSKVDDLLLPVLKKLNERNLQTHIDSFFSVTLKKQTNLFPSKRVMSALQKITSPQKGETSNKAAAKPVKRKARTSAKKAVPKKINKRTSVARGGKSNVNPQGPALSESSSDSS